MFEQTLAHSRDPQITKGLNSMIYLSITLLKSKDSIFVFRSMVIWSNNKEQIEWKDGKKVNEKKNCIRHMYK